MKYLPDLLVTFLALFLSEGRAPVAKYLNIGVLSRQLLPREEHPVPGLTAPLELF